MKHIKSNKKYLWNFYVFPLVFFTVACYPTSKLDIEMQPEQKDEKHFPNGTVIGRYTYTDNEGNPIQVKYYADEASYGVELKSFKVVDSTGEPLSSASSASTLSQNFQAIQNSHSKNEYNAAKSSEPESNIVTDILTNSNYFPAHLSGNKYKNTADPYDFLNKEISKSNHYKIEKSNPDYEIYYQNELKGPKKCNKEKVRVYFDTEKRNMRSVDNNLDADKFCEQF